MCYLELHWNISRNPLWEQEMIYHFNCLLFEQDYRIAIKVIHIQIALGVTWPSQPFGWTINILIGIEIENVLLFWGCYLNKKLPPSQIIRWCL